jgi:FdhE protein
MAYADPLDDAERRWLRLVDEWPDLGAAVDMQRVLVTRCTELTAVSAAIIGGASAAPPDLLERLARQRIPVLDLAVDLDVERLLPFLLGFCDDFIDGGAGDPARRVRAALDGGEFEPASLLRASLARRQDAIRQRANHVGVAPDLVCLITELTVGPIAHRLQHDALVSAATAPAAVREAVRGWSRGECPACGSWPALAETRDGERHARCSFCGADWTPRAGACIYCAAADDGFLTAEVGEAHGDRRVELCRACGNYLKQVDVAEATAFPLLPVLDLETCNLDVQAAGRGYARPPMREIAAARTPCPEGA